MFRDFYLQWEITNRCNLHCKHCYIDTTSAIPSLDDLKGYFIKYENLPRKFNGRINVALTGGEPLVHPDWDQLVEFLQEHPLVDQIGIFSNGVLIDDQVAQRIRELRVDGVQISLDGGDKKTHDLIRGEESFTQTMQGINNLKNQNIPITTHFTLHRLNQDSFPELIELCLELGISNILVSKLIPIGTGAALKKEVISPKEWYYFYKQYSPLNDKYAGKLEIEFDRVVAHRNDSNSAGCVLGGPSTSLLVDGSVMVCRRLPIVVGNLNQEEMLDIWFKKKEVWELRDRKQLKGYCKDCELVKNCGGCRANAYAMTGDVFAEDPYCLQYLEKEYGYADFAD